MSLLRSLRRLMVNELAEITFRLMFNELAAFSI